MGDLNEDLLNYEADLLEDDMLDDNEDELLLSDDDNADVEALLSDSEDWINDELRSKSKAESGDSSSNAVSGSNDIAEIRQDSPEESAIVREPSPVQRHEKPTGSNEKTTEHVSSTPDKSLELGDPDQSQESGVSNAVDSTWVNTPDACGSNNLEEVDGNFVRNNNEVSSTNAEDERAAQQLEGSKCVSSSSIDSTPTSERNHTPATSVSSEIVSSINDTPLTTSNETVEREAETTETEEDERGERVNPKLSVEKPEENLNNKGIRITSGHKNHKQSSNSFGGITPLYSPRNDFPYGPNRAPFPQHRPGFGPIRAPYFIPRPGFGSLPLSMRPGMMRPDMRIPFDPTRPRQQIPMYPRGPMGSFPPNAMPPNQMPYPSGGLNLQPPIPIIPKKVLINPNFKGGGLEAATSQLLKDTHQFGSRSLTDEELLRQQEEFITKNLMHVEKRRHESPPPRLRSRSRSPRSRSRSYSPQRKHRSREKDWRPYNNKRNWRRNNDDWNKRRRIDDKEKDENPDDDEETREYRRKVAEQKALREKMLRDKERRRRELAEENKRQLQEEEEKRKKEEPVLKCKPVVVTKKIISLKAIKSSGSDNEDKKLSQDSGLSSSGNGKNMSLNKISSDDDDIKTMAVVKPIQKLQTTKKPVIDDIDEKLEAELLEESRTPSPPPPALLNSNRRVIIKSKPKLEETVTEEATSKKHIFDRLDRKSSTIGIDSSAKRKIQRLVSDKSK